MENALLETKQWSIEPSGCFYVWNKSSPCLYKYHSYLIGTQPLFINFDSLIDEVAAFNSNF